MKRPKSTTVLLAVIAVLLGMNLWHVQAKAQPQVQVAPRLLGIMAPAGNNAMLRLWSDGVVEWRLWNGGSTAQWLAGSEWVEMQEVP